MPPPQLQLQLQPSSPSKQKPRPKPKPPALQGAKKGTLYPPLGGVEAQSGQGKHAAGSSVSSFHSVSLSADNATDSGTYRAPTPSSLTESFEEIDIPSPMHNPPPPLPHRPPLPYVPRRVPPPPPPSTSRASDRSSVQSLASATSSSLIQTPTLTTPLPLPINGSSPLVKTKRPTPVPSAARKRYTSVFNANVIQRRRAEAQNPSPKKLSHTEAKAKRTRQAAGWRGLSVDLITATPEELLAHDQSVKGKQKEWDLELVVDESVGPDERLEGEIVSAIWSRSRIEKPKLAEIWNECDPDGRGSLDANSFARGMWRIDEHLRRTQAQTSALRNATSTSLTSLRSGLGSLKMKPGVHRSTSRSSIGTSISRSSSVNGSSANPPPPPLPKLVLR